MKGWKRAWLSILRRPFKSILLFLIIFMLGNLMASSIYIQLNTEKAQKEIREGLGGKIIFRLKEDQIKTYYEDFGNGLEDNQKLTDFILSLQEDARVKDLYVVPYYTGFHSKQVFEDASHSSVDPKINTSVNLPVKGVNSTQLLDIMNGNIELVEGRMFTQEEIDQGKNVILLEESAVLVNEACESIVEKNEGDFNVYECVRKSKPIHVGDQIQLNRTVLTVNEAYDGFEYYEEAGEIYEIVGIFRHLKEPISSFNVYGGESLSLNSFTYFVYVDGYVPTQNIVDEIEVMGQIYKKFENRKNEHNESYLAPLDYTFDAIEVHVKDPEDVQMVKDELMEKLKKDGLDFLELLASSDAYDTVAGPIHSLSSIANITLFISILVSIVVLSLTVFLFLKERHSEIGIYLALGEKKKRIVSQILLEVCLVGSVAIGLSLLSGNWIGQQISNDILKQEAMKVSSSEMEEIKDVNEQNLTIYGAIDQVDMKMDEISIVMIVGISSLVLVVATGISVMWVFRYQPSDILLKHKNE